MTTPIYNMYNCRNDITAPKGAVFNFRVVTSDGKVSRLYVTKKAALAAIKLTRDKEGAYVNPVHLYQGRYTHIDFEDHYTLCSGVTDRYTNQRLGC